MMKNRLRIVLLLSLLACGGGCAMCCSEFDNDYPVYGGKNPRHDMQHGRVGSVFSPAGYTVEEASITTEGGQPYYDEIPMH